MDRTTPIKPLELPCFITVMHVSSIRGSPGFQETTKIIASVRPVVDFICTCAKRRPTSPAPTTTICRCHAVHMYARLVPRATSRYRQNMARRPAEEPTRETREETMLPRSPAFPIPLAIRQILDFQRRVTLHRMRQTFNLKP